ncbi:hypothetical protein O3G_MSEX004456 [Manduca sexta]|uniref:Reverse transcriptase domain-containing protein n=1 Tax=Manduca sexta TaxID=7130 RepID=A0A921YVK4_MANSE|nr:hypothetical protein O3G_MSEX004456 [Manduca sexta]
MALNPLSTLLLDSGLGYRLRRGSEPISHLLYMDDLKLFASKQTELIELLKITEKFSNSINMEFGVDKCAVIHVKRGEVVVSDDIQISETVRLKSLSETETYKYLGMPEALGIISADVKQSVRERFFGRLRKILYSFLSGGNKIRAFNGWGYACTHVLFWYTQMDSDQIGRPGQKGPDSTDCTSYAPPTFVSDELVHPAEMWRPRFT